MTEDEFIENLVGGITPAPAYFSHNVEMNKRGARALSNLDKIKRLVVERVEGLKEKDAALLDLRTNVEFGEGFIPGSINIGLQGRFAPYAGELLNVYDSIVFVANDQEQASEGRMRLARVGLENVLGWISADDYKNAQRELLVVEQITIKQLKEKISKEGDALQVLDVRQPSEFAAGHIADAVALPLGDLNEKIDAVGLSRPTAVICNSGYRSSIACSIIRKNNCQTLFNVLGGMRGWSDAEYHLVQ